MNVLQYLEERVHRPVAQAMYQFLKELDPTLLDREVLGETKFACDLQANLEKLPGEPLEFHSKEVEFDGPPVGGRTHKRRRSIYIGGNRISFPS